MQVRGAHRQLHPRRHRMAASGEKINIKSQSLAGAQAGAAENASAQARCGRFAYMGTCPVTGADDSGRMVRVTLPNVHAR